MEGIKKYKFAGENKILGIEGSNLKKSLEFKRVTFSKFEFLNRKLDLVDKASKINNLDFYSRNSKNSGFIKAMVQCDMLYCNFIGNNKLDRAKLESDLAQIDNLLERVINEIEVLDCVKRKDPNFCRVGINYGRKHIEKALNFIFGFHSYYKFDQKGNPAQA